MHPLVHTHACMRARRRHGANPPRTHARACMQGPGPACHPSHTHCTAYTHARMHAGPWPWTPRTPPRCWVRPRRASLPPTSTPLRAQRARQRRCWAGLPHTRAPARPRMGTCRCVRACLCAAHRRHTPPTSMILSAVGNECKRMHTHAHTHAGWLEAAGGCRAAARAHHAPARWPPNRRPPRRARSCRPERRRHSSGSGSGSSAAASVSSRCRGGSRGGGGRGCAGGAARAPAARGGCGARVRVRAAPGPCARCVWMCACACVCVFACVRVRVCVQMCVLMRSVRALV